MAWTQLNWCNLSLSSYPVIPMKATVESLLPGPPSANTTIHTWPSTTRSTSPPSGTKLYFTVAYWVLLSFTLLENPLLHLTLLLLYLTLIYYPLLYSMCSALCYWILPCHLYWTSALPYCVLLYCTLIYSFFTLFGNFFLYSVLHYSTLLHTCNLYSVFINVLYCT